MATFYLIRHGKPDYTYGDNHSFIGHGIAFNSICNCGKLEPAGMFEVKF